MIFADFCSGFLNYILNYIPYLLEETFSQTNDDNVIHLDFSGSFMQITQKMKTSVDNRQFSIKHNQAVSLHTCNGLAESSVRLVINNYRIL
jgi:hypothetical protein